jgi:dsRNA-specific ribonuclease
MRGPDIDRALAELERFGLADPEPALREAVGVALVHKSYLYENQDLLPGLTRGLLDAFSDLGLAFTRRLAAADAYQRLSSAKVGSLSHHVAQLALRLPSWANEQAWLIECAALGGSLTREAPPSSVPGNLCRQLIGVLCHGGADRVAAALLGGLLSDVRQRLIDSVGDPKTLLQEVLSPHTVSFAYEREGPDHDQEFRAVAADGLGRRGAGEGKSKKAASQSASLDFLKRHFPQALKAPNVAATPKPCPIALPQPRKHYDTVQWLRGLFALPSTATPLLSQALIHSSWAYEHRPELAKHRQQDNRVLAFVGSQAAIYEDALVAVRQAVADPPEEFTFRNADNEAYDKVFRQSRMAGGLLLGTGQASQGVPVEMGSNAFQAVIGALFVAKGFPESLASFWPAAWTPIWETIARSEPRSADPTTILQQATSTMRLQVEYELHRTGPDHAGRYQASIALHSEALGVGTELRGAKIAGGKTRAKHDVSATVLQVLDRLSCSSPARELDDATPREAGLARFLLAHQAAVLATASVPLPRWAAKKLFGLHLATSPAELLDWTSDVDSLLDSRITMGTVGPRMQEAFRASLEAATQPANSADVRLAHLLNLVGRVSTPEDLSRDHLEQLVQLCNVYRCLGAEEQETDLLALTADWQLLYPGRVVIPPRVPVVRLDGRERAVLDAAVSTVMPSKAKAKVVITSVRPLRMQILPTGVHPPRTAVIETMCVIWSNVSRTVAVSPAQDGIEVAITTVETPAEPAPITAAALAALAPRPEPYRAAQADLLHDLKNQAFAARQAAAMPAATETARLEQQLAARRHLEKAQTIGLRLQAVTSPMEEVSDANAKVEIGTFLRRYAGAALAWLPVTVSLSIPNASSATHVTLDERALTAILDNLVRNAVDALPHGGSIKLDWAADQFQAVLEVADDGPGLPAEVRRALDAGLRIRSVKTSGSGIGLLAVKSLLRRVGGELALAPQPSGTAWLITVPIAVAQPAELP